MRTSIMILCGALRKQAQEEWKRTDQRRQERSRMRAEVDTLRSEFDASQQHRDVQFEATACVIGQKEDAMIGRIEDAVRDVRRELLREIEQLAAKVKKLEAQQGRQQSSKGEFKFAHERDEEAETSAVDLPKFLPAPVVRKTHMN